MVRMYFYGQQCLDMKSIGVPEAYYLNSEVTKKLRSIRSSLGKAGRKEQLMFDVPAGLYGALPSTEKASKP